MPRPAQTVPNRSGRRAGRVSGPVITPVRKRQLLIQPQISKTRDERDIDVRAAGYVSNIHPDGHAKASSGTA